MKVTLTINTVDSIPQTLDSALYMLRHALTPLRGAMVESAVPTQI